MNAIITLLAVNCFYLPVYLPTIKYQKEHKQYTTTEMISPQNYDFENIKVLIDKDKKDTEIRIHEQWNESLENSIKD